jgi:chromosome segregation ATPase
MSDLNPLSDPALVFVLIGMAQMNMAFEQEELPVSDSDGEAVTSQEAEEHRECQVAVDMTLQLDVADHELDQLHSKIMGDIFEIKEKLDDGYFVSVCDDLRRAQQHRQKMAMCYSGLRSHHRTHVWPSVRYKQMSNEIQDLRNKKWTLERQLANTQKHNEENKKKLAQSENALIAAKKSLEDVSRLATTQEERIKDFRSTIRGLTKRNQALTTGSITKRKRTDAAIQADDECSSQGPSQACLIS